MSKNTFAEDLEEDHKGSKVIVIIIKVWYLSTRCGSL
jgi:hypothetical protein